MGEHQGVHPGARCGGRRLLHRRVVVQDVSQSLHGYLLNEILADHGVHQRIRTAGQLIE